jgi:6-phosphofructo-2-kinase/fructose-2,6-biphosphatase 4
MRFLMSLQYAGWDPKEAVQHYLWRIQAKIPDYEPMDEEELNYIKMINAGEKMIVNNISFGYLPHRINFYLMNLHIKSRRTFFVRAGTSKETDSYKADANLSEQGIDYARKITNRLEAHREEERQALIKLGGEDIPLKPLLVWTSTRMRTVETAQFFLDRGYRVQIRPQMSQLNPGICEKMSERRLRAEFADEVAKHEADPYHLSLTSTWLYVLSQSSWNLSGNRTIYF